MLKYIKGSDKMKKYDMVLLLQMRQEILNNIIEKRGIQDKQVLKLSRKIDKLQNKLYYL